MAKGGEEIVPLLEHTDDKEEEEEDYTRTFSFPDPVGTSTPHNPGETFEMRRLHEQSGLPDTSYQETDFGGTPTPTTEELERRLNALRDSHTGLLDMSKIELQNILLSPEDKQKEIQRVQDFIKSRYPNAKLDTLKIRFSTKNLNQIVVVGPKGGETKILLDDGSGLLKSFLNMTFVKNALGDKAETILKNTSAAIQKRQKELKSERKKKELAEKSLREQSEKIKETKPLDALKEQESDLQRQNAEDQAIIQDENASPSDIEAVRERVEERNEELARLQTQIEERERARPLLERVKEIFKKYGVTVTAIALAAGVTIGVVVSSITKALKATGKALGKGLKDIGAKLASLLPGLIGSIASFLFKAAGQAIGFLAEHTWLLILAVVAFLVEKYLKKRR